MTEETQRILVAHHEGVTTITLNRPDNLNALNLAALHELDLALTRANANEAVRCIVLTGAGRAFCAGADVKEWASEGAEVPSEPEEGWVPTAHRIVARLYRTPKPVIAAVNGVAVGAGLDLALACDFRVASEKARFGSVYIRLGIPPDAGASFLLPRIVGVTKAKEMIYTGRIIDAPEALECGLVSMVVPVDELTVKANEFAAELAKGPTLALGMAKENIQEHWNASIEGALRNEERAGRFCITTLDHKEGLAAVNEKRQPTFQAR